jgi:hypothetical protein
LMEFVLTVIRGVYMILLVIRAANLLKVDELELFRLAHRFWHYHTGESCPQINAAFNEYLEKKTAPPWVIHFARSVVRAYDCGNFEPAMFGIYPSYEEIPLSWSLAFQTPLSLPLNHFRDLLIA